GRRRGVVGSRARSLGVEREGTVTGFREDVRPYLAACDVVYLYSLTTEALSLAAIEAMAMAKPLVHSQVGGATELIEPGRNGMLFPPGDTGALVECLSQLKDPDIRLAMGRSGRAKAEAAFDEGAMIDRYEQLLLGVCGASGGEGNALASRGQHAGAVGRSAGDRAGVGRAGPAPDPRGRNPSGILPRISAADGVRAGDASPCRCGGRHVEIRVRGVPALRGLDPRFYLSQRRRLRPLRRACAPRLVGARAAASLI